MKCFTKNPDATKRLDKHQTKADRLQDQRAGLDTGRKFATGYGERAGSGGGYSEVDRRAADDARRRREDEDRKTEERKVALSTFRCLEPISVSIWRAQFINLILIIR